MEEFFTFLEDQRIGILILFAILAALILLVQWLAWIFSLGRYGGIDASTRRDESLQYILTRFLANIIDDFRHLLALIIVLIFAVVLGYAIIQAGNDFDKITQALQSVVSTLGAIIGSILGYYFGESAATKALARDQLPTPGGEPELPSEIEPAPEPPPPPDSDSQGSGA